MVYIILLNWNGWRDTIECLESVFRLSNAAFRVIVCDNASEDNSLDRIADWASGSLPAECSNPELQHLSSPPYPKPIPFLRIEAGEQIGLGIRSEHLFLVATGANLGFAGGNNVGLRLALRAGDLQYAWLLNNDTVVRPDALSSMIKRMEERPDAGICGSTLLFYRDPVTVQCLGGSVYNRWLARTLYIGSSGDARHLPPASLVEAKMKYVLGASVLVRKEFLEVVGLMNEEYFLYFEEIDWVTRAAGRFGLAYSPESVVYHKEGSTIGPKRPVEKYSAVSVFHFIRGRVLFTRRHHPFALLSVCTAILLSAALHVGGRSRATLLGLKDGLRRSKAG